jgi:hypothetical protein
LLKAVVGRRPRTELGGIQGFPLAARAEDEEDGVGTDAIGGTWPAAAERMGIDVRRNGEFQEFPEFVGDTPIVGNGGRIHD